MTKTSALLIAALSISFSATSFAFLDFFKGDLDKVPESAEIRAQDAEASVKRQAAMELESAGKSDKALDIYKSIVKKWPITTSAAMSQYKIGAIQKSQGDYVKAFDSFQKFVDDYKQSSAFNAAIASQFEIAKASQTGEHKEKFIGISRKVQRSEVLEMYQSVIKNAPYSEYAPQAQFSIGEVLEEDDKNQLAVQEYKKVVASYPETKLASDAQYRIAEIGRKAIDSGSRNAANIAVSRDAYNDVMLVDQADAARREEARNRVVQFDELEAKKAFDVGRFYEKQKKYKSAALYYRRVAQSTGTSAAAEAQERLEIVEAKMSNAPVAAQEEPSGFRPGAAVGGAAQKIKNAIPRPKLGSRLFGRKKRAEQEAEEARLATLERSKPAPTPVASNEPTAVATKKPMASPATGSQVASVPAATKLSQRKGYHGPPKLGLSKKKNNMRLDSSMLQDAPFDIGKLDKKDLEKGLKKISEVLPEGMSSDSLKKLPKELPDDLSDLVIPPDIDEENAIGKLKELAKEVTGDDDSGADDTDTGDDESGDDEESLKIPPVPEDE